MGFNKRLKKTIKWQEQEIYNSTNNNNTMALITIKTSNITAENVISTKVDSSIIKTIILTQVAYDALGSYSSSTIYVTTV